MKKDEILNENEANSDENKENYNENNHEIMNDNDNINKHNIINNNNNAQNNLQNMLGSGLPPNDRNKNNNNLLNANHNNMISQSISNDNENSNINNNNKHLINSNKEDIDDTGTDTNYKGETKNCEICTLNKPVNIFEDTSCGHIYCNGLCFVCFLLSLCVVGCAWCACFWSYVFIFSVLKK